MVAGDRAQLAQGFDGFGGPAFVTQSFRREGDAVFYDLTLEDPEVLAEPLVFPTRILRRNMNANAALIPERGHCETAFETEAAATQIRH